KIFQILYNYKLKWMKAGYKQKYASPLADLLAFRKVKNRLGGRIRLIVSGGAPLSIEIEEFLRVTSCAFVCQGYGKSSKNKHKLTSYFTVESIPVLLYFCWVQHVK
nr:long chain acyl-CoA synthetase 1-like [Tanacetum cinerariifolium]